MVSEIAIGRMGVRYMDQKEERRSLGIYIHIPFCVKKCDYCDFLSAPADETTKRRYINALLTEIYSYRGNTDAYEVETIFIGGGTPSCIPAEDIAKILHAVREVFHVKGYEPEKKQGFLKKLRGGNKKTEDAEPIEKAEITIEINPGTVTGDKLFLYREAGINRLSIGLQSADDKELNILGRIHDYKTFQTTYQIARNMGFQNINVDLISAVPGQTLESWEDTLRKVVELHPEHISAYSLIIEEGTPFYETYGEDGNKAETKIPDEDTDRTMYQRTKEILKEAGYERYEISNYCRPHYECKHNNSYWTGVEYLGIGLGSSSLLHNARFHNVSDLGEYMTSCEAYQKSQNTKKKKDIYDNEGFIDDTIGLRRELERLVESQRMEEFMFLGLRRMEGVSKSDFQFRFKKPIETIYGDVINRLVKEGLLVNEGDYISLTDYGIDVSNVVLAQFLLGEFVRC